jgi:hypothetical protein
MARVRLALAIAVVGAGITTAGCGGDDETYSVEETKAAFARNGIELVAPDSPELAAADGRYLAPSSGETYLVVVTTDAEVDDAWPDFERMQDGDSFDARRANVGVFADDGPSAAHRARVLAALASLPERGFPVEVAGDSSK